MRRTEPQRNTDIEVLRAIAIVFTLVSHFLWGLLPAFGATGLRLQSSLQFWTGVDLFFCISGFVITASLLRQWRKEAPVFASMALGRWRQFWVIALPFWIRRMFRLLPSAWLWIIVTLLLAAGFNAHDSFGPLRDNLTEAAAALLNVANFHYYEWFAHGYSTYGSFGVFWSLSLEEQFYLIFPFLLFFLPRRILAPLLFAGFLAQALVFRPDGFIPHHTSLLWFVRTDALLLGVLLAFWKNQASYHRLEPRALRRAWLSLPIIGGFVGLLCVLPAPATTNPYSTGLIAICCGVLVWIASYDRHYVLVSSRTKDALVWLGTRSYSLYLIHTIGHAFVLEAKKTAGIAQGGVLSQALTLLSVGLVLALSELNYRLVEKPSREAGRRLADQFVHRLRRTSPVRSVANAPVYE